MKFDFIKVGLRAFTVLISVYPVLGFAQSSGFPIDQEAPYISPPSIERELDKQLVSEAIPGEVVVRSGSAGYSFPVIIPPGIGGVQPSVSIDYSSMSGNGLLGLKWNLKANSAISRVGQSQLYDNGHVTGVRLTSSDRLALDGQRLVLESGTHLAVGSVYRTYMESHQKIEFLDGGGIQVTQKDGTIRLYGTLASHRVEVPTSGGDVTYSWLLYRIIDRNQNYIEYEYVNNLSSSDIRLNRILYTGNLTTSFAPKGEVKFYYRNRADDRTSFLPGGFQINSHHLLNRIQTTYNDSLYTEYNFEYSFNSGVTGNDYSRLVEVHYAIKGEAPNTTIISWPTPTGEVQMTNVNLPDYPTIDRDGRAIPMDINGDGRTDILTLEHTKLSDGTCWAGLEELDIYNHQYRVYANIVQPNGQFVRTAATSSFISNWKPDECVREGFARIWPGDFNGDGLMDFLIHRVQIDVGQLSNTNNRFFVDIYLNSPANPGTFSFLRTDELISTMPHGYQNSMGTAPIGEGLFELQVADYDGDGLTDYGYPRAISATWDPAINYVATWAYAYSNADGTVEDIHCDPTQTYYNGPLSPSQFQSFENSHLADFDGDGKLDVLIVGQDDSQILASESRGVYTSIYSGGFPNSYHFIRTGDFNGDGKSDLLIRTTNGTWSVNYFNGSAFEWPGEVVSLNQPMNFELDGNGKVLGYSDAPFLYIEDVDKDGRDDILFFRRYLTNWTFSIKVAYNKVTGWIISEHSVNSSWMNTQTNVPLDEIQQGTFPIEIRQGEFFFADFEGDGDPNFFHYYKNTSGGKFGFNITFRNNDKSAYVSDILDGLNRRISFSYLPLSNLAVYQRTNFPAYPTPSLCAPINVCSGLSIRTYDNSLIRSESYSYKNLRINLLGGGFLGFGYEIQNDLLSGVTKTRIKGLIKETGATSPYWPFMQTSEEQSDDGLNIFRTEFTYGTSVLRLLASGKSIFNPLVVEKKTVNYTTGTSERQVLAFDGNDNPTSTESYRYSNLSYGPSWIFKEITTLSGYVTNGSFIPWQPSTIQKTTQRSGKSAITEVQTLQYSGNGNLISKTDRSGTDAAVITAYTYDNYGNVLSQSITPNNMSVRTTGFEYTGAHRFLGKKTNPLGWETYTKYDGLSGRVIRTVDINGLVTESAYDAWGRMISTTFPDNTTSTREYLWNPVIESSHLLIVRNSDANDTPFETWLDGAGREVLSRKMNRNNLWINTKTEYTNTGQVYRTSLPYLDAETPLWVTITYDALDRKTSVASSVETTTWSYTSNTETESKVNGGSTIIRTKDATGVVINIADNLTSTNYSYDSRNNVDGITGPSGQTLVIKYDVAGRQVELNDPATGVIIYGYDALDQRVYQKDAKNQIVTTSYDLLGRPTERVSTEGVYTYTYDTYLGKIHSLVGPGGVENEYGYDALGRNNKTTEKIGGQSYELRKTFYTNGLVDEIIYPIGFAVKHEYNSHGQLIRISKSDDQSTVWEWVDEDINGQVTAYTLGDVTWEETFDGQTGLPISVSSSANWHMEYNFNQSNGNLLSRSDMTTNISESFHYDDLDRLSNYDGPSEYVETNYDDAGNITYKTDVGEYTVDDATGRTLEVTNDQSKISLETQTIEYTSFNSVSHISEGDVEALFEYGPDDQRRHMLITDGGNPVVERYYYFGGLYERDFYDGAWRVICKVLTPSGERALFIADEGSGDGQMRYINSDYLGSVLAITEPSGDIIESYSFDAWGNRRNPGSWANVYTPIDTWQGYYYRGFTGHEHLDHFGLINMNGRLYDPLIGRMLSTDNYVQDATSTQNFNRYSYAFNNPLRYVDANGEFSFIPLLIHAMVNLTVDLIVSKGDMSHAQIATSFLTGALGGALGGAGNASNLFAFKSALVSQVNKLIPNIPITETENFSVSISPLVGFGTGGFSAAGSVNWNFKLAGLNLSLSRTLGFDSGLNSLGESVGPTLYTGNSGYIGYFDGNGLWGGGYGYNMYSGLAAQGVGVATILAGDFTLRVDEDYIGDGFDRYRTGGLLATYKIDDELTLAFGLSMLTGEPNKEKRKFGNHPTLDTEEYGKGMYDNAYETLSSLRGGTVYGGAIYKNQTYFIGRNSEKTLQWIQRGIHRWITTPYFEDLGSPSRWYSNFGGYHTNHLYY